jgi:predicted HTH transcriptional regulator
MYEDNKAINNQSVRERFGIERRNSALATRIISETINSGLLKISNPENESKKYATYIPFYG